MIRVVSGKEIAERWALITIANTAIFMLTAFMPYWFELSLHAAAHATVYEPARAALENLRSYAFFTETQWCSTGLVSALFLLALVGGAPAIAGERERRTLALTIGTGIRIEAYAAVKFGVNAAWLALVTLVSAAVLAAHSAVTALPLPAGAVVAASFVAWMNAVAFLAVVTLASSLTKRTVFAAALGVAIGLAIVVLLLPFGVDAAALGRNLFGVDGGVRWEAFAFDVAFAFIVTFAALAGARAALVRRPLG